MSQLNKSSYSVYIIHVVVMGVIALAMMSLQLPGFIKFLMLTVFTFILSNGIVYVYHRWFKENISLRAATFSILVVALFSFIQFGNKATKLTEIEQSHAFNLPGVGLHEAVITGNLEVIKQHINAGANLDERDPSGGSSPLITAAVFGKTEIALTLIKAGADLNFKNNEGSTPLHTSAFFCRTEIVEALLADGADVSIKNHAGSTALESVMAPFETVKGYYDYFSNAFGSMGLKLDYEQLKATRPIIAEMLRNSYSE